MAYWGTPAVNNIACDDWRVWMQVEVEVKEVTSTDGMYVCVCMFTGVYMCMCVCVYRWMDGWMDIS